MWRASTKSSTRNVRNTGQLKKRYKCVAKYMLDDAVAYQHSSCCLAFLLCFFSFLSFFHTHTRSVLCPIAIDVSYNVLQPNTCVRSILHYIAYSLRSKCSEDFTARPQFNSHFSHRARAIEGTAIALSSIYLLLQICLS